MPGTVPGTWQRLVDTLTLMTRSVLCLDTAPGPVHTQHGSELRLGLEEVEGSFAFPRLENEDGNDSVYLTGCCKD